MTVQDRVNPYQDIYLDGLLLPKYGTLTEITEPNAARVLALDGSTHVDFYNNRRIWSIKWDVLAYTDWQSIFAKYQKQFSAQQFLQFSVEGLDIHTAVFMGMGELTTRSTDPTSKAFLSPHMWSGQWVSPFSISLEEQFAIS